MTTTPDFRALCAELGALMIDLASTHPNLSENGVRVVNELSDRADAALATPPPEPPTDEEIEEWADAATEVPLETMDPDINGWQRCFTKEEFCASIRAVLERWGK